MVFSSLIFLFIFLPLVVLCYYLVPKNMKNLILFLFSLFFYGWGEPIYISLMMFSTLVDYTHGLLIHKYKLRGENKKAKRILLSSIFINLSMLMFFKYSNFFLSNINNIFNTDINLLQIALPVGISFYTFQTMSYSIDVYTGKADVQKNLISFGAYVTLFPQLIAGPIVQYKTIDKQLNQRTESLQQFSYGIIRFTIGLGKKVILANNLGFLWTQIISKNISNLSVACAWLGIILFALQIYFDFSGYSDMAIGLGNMFGFSFNENFNYPYESKNITEFWRRWHISLGSWFREYVYIPLGGNKHHQIRNICIVWLLTGFWHGASWNFMSWGVYFGTILIIEKFILNKIITVNSRIYSLFLILMGWVIFAFDNFSNGIIFIKSMFGLNKNILIDSYFMYTLTSNITLILIGIVAATSIPKKLINYLFKDKNNTWYYTILETIFIALILFISIAFLVNNSYNPFLYFRF